MNSMWERYQRLSRSERQDLLWGMAMIPAAATYVKLFGVKRWRRAAEKRAGTESAAGQAEPGQLREAQAAARMIEAASRNGIARGNCLSKSVALWWLLKRKGINAQLRIGARKTGEELEAHAWAELGGRIINDADDVHERFAALGAPMTSRVAARK